MYQLIPPIAHCMDCESHMQERPRKVKAQTRPRRHMSRITVVGVLIESLVFQNRRGSASPPNRWTISDSIGDESRSFWGETNSLSAFSIGTEREPGSHVSGHEEAGNHQGPGRSASAENCSMWVFLCWAMAAIHDQPSNNFFLKKCEKKATQKQMKMQKQRNLLCFCICFAFFFFFPGTTSALMRTFTRQQYLLYAPREKAKKQRTTMRT